MDLDPCSDSQAQQHVQAGQYFAAVDDGLSKPWHGRVFVNPPFGGEQSICLSGSFIHNAAREHASNHTSEIILVLKAAVGYAWFMPVLQQPHAWLNSRISFLLHGNEGLQNPHGSIVVYMGHDPCHFADVFSSVACIPGRSCWSLDS